VCLVCVCVCLVCVCVFNVCVRDREGKVPEEEQWAGHIHQERVDEVM
jgi:hypothetical protein